MRSWLLLGTALLSACSSSTTGTPVTCGDGTMLVGDMCVGTGSGSNTTCGTGTHLDGTACVPDSPPPAGAPAITSITPDHSGATGYVLFQIQGTGFAGADVTDLHVYFGDTTPGTNGDLGPCEAEVGAATDTTIGGEVPPACDLSVVVTVTTNKGMATTPFHYDALFAADGDGGGAFGEAGDLYIIDPFAQLSIDMGPLVDANTTGYGLSGLAFSSTGTLYGVTTGTSPGDLGTAQLVTIAPGTATVTVVGDLVDASANAYYVTDIKMSGTTLYGWGVVFGTTTTGSLVTIDTASGTVTPVGTPGTATYTWNGGVAIDGAGAITVAGNAAGADTDTSFTSTGELDSVDTTSGALTSVATLDYPIGAPVNAMAYVGTVLVAAVDNGTYGAFNAAGFPVYGEQLAVIDPAGTTIVGPLFELPAQLGAQSHVDALDMAPVTLTLAHTLRQRVWAPLGPATAVKR